MLTRHVAIGLLAVLLGSVLLVNRSCVRTTTIDVGDGDKLTYSIRWGWGMKQRVGFSSGRFPSWSSELGEYVWKRPYWSGGPLYANTERSQYYVVLMFGIYRIDVMKKTVEHLCSVDENLALDYLGQFSLTQLRSSSRGDDVTFTPAGQTPPAESGVKAGRQSFRNRCG